MKKSPAVIRLAALIAVLALVAAGAGLFWPTGSGPDRFTSLRGETAQLYGHGLYRADSLFIGAGFQAQDTVTLLLGIPLLIIATLLYRRNSLKGGLLLTGILAYFLYGYASMALSASFNNLFLVYVALFSASFFALVLAVTSINLASVPVAILDRLPRRGPAIYLFASGILTLVVWLLPLLSALLQNQTPPLLAHYTTKITDALDLALITPSTITAGSLILHRDPLGYRIAFPLLGIIIMLLPIIVLSTYYQIAAGIVFSPGQIVGPITGFAVLGLLAIWVLVAILRILPDPTPRAQRVP